MSHHYCHKNRDLIRFSSANTQNYLHVSFAVQEKCPLTLTYCLYPQVKCYFWTRRNETSQRTRIVPACVLLVVIEKHNDYIEASLNPGYLVDSSHRPAAATATLTQIQHQLRAEC